MPVNGDFDADGKNDIAIWRPSTGDWWIIKQPDASSYVVTGDRTATFPFSKFANAPKSSRVLPPVWQQLLFHTDEKGMPQHLETCQRRKAVADSSAPTNGRFP